MEISFTVRRGSDDQPLTFSFLAPAVQAALRRGLQAAAQRAQQGQRGEVPSGEGGTNLTAQNVFSAIPVTVPATAPATAAATSAAANSSAASAAAPTGTMGPSPASAVAAAAAATGMAQPDLTRMIERIHRMSGAVAGSIFQDLIAGAIQPGEAGPPPASDGAIDRLVREAAPAEGQGQCSVCLADLASEEKVTHSPQCIKMPCGHRFHEKCLLQWLRSHNTCPVCRFAVEATAAPRPTPLSTVLQNWHERRRGTGGGGGGVLGGSAGGGGSFVGRRWRCDGRRRRDGDGQPGWG